MVPSRPFPESPLPISDPSSPGAAGSARVSAGAREALLATALLLLLLWGGKHLAPALPWGADLVFTAAAAFQLYVPLWLIQRGRELPESHGIHVHGALLAPIQALRHRRLRARRRRPPGQRARSGWDAWLADYGRGATCRPRALAADLGRAAGAAVVTFIPFAVAHHYWLQAWAPGAEAVSYAFRLPPDLISVFLKNVLLIALPEEVFYRGFLETRLERRWPVKRYVWAIPLGRTVFAASFFFALGHFLGEYSPARLGPFFPAFLFSALTRKSGSVAGAVLYHGMANSFSYSLYYGYFGG